MTYNAPIYLSDTLIDAWDKSLRGHMQSGYPSDQELCFWDRLDRNKGRNRRCTPMKDQKGDGALSQHTRFVLKR